MPRPQPLQRHSTDTYEYHGSGDEHRNGRNQEAILTFKTLPYCNEPHIRRISGMGASWRQSVPDRRRASHHAVGVGVTGRGDRHSGVLLAWLALEPAA